VNQPGDEVTVRKMDPAGGEKWRWRAVVRHATSSSLQVEARFNAPEVDRFGIEFRRGDRILESYFADRWYNIFAVYGADTGVFKGWYCNISRPADLKDGRVDWVDLELDVVVLPDHRSAVTRTSPPAPPGGRAPGGATGGRRALSSAAARAFALRGG
jgi:hypothetical protein